MLLKFQEQLYSDGFQWGKVESGKAQRGKVTKDQKNGSDFDGHVFISATENSKWAQEIIQKNAPVWQQKNLFEKNKDTIHFVGEKGAFWILQKKSKTQEQVLPESDLAWFRDKGASLLGFFKAYELKNIKIDFLKSDKDCELGFFMGLNMAAYQYKNKSEKLPQIHVNKKLSESELQDIRGRSLAINNAKHLVNLPSNIKNPQTILALVKKHFQKRNHFKLEIWDEKKLKKENMNLHLAVGQSSKSEPCLIKIHYRPHRSVNKKPIIFVGKGITFDTGGLDIKPSSAMRLMKKDMAGSAAVLALSFWLEEVNYPRPVDLYLALAENSVDANSMRPGDVVVARNGISVEIHNTDAEGRLVLADALDVAVQSDPEVIIDFATLTGACRVALGAEIAGLFSNHDKYASLMHEAGLRAGDLNWRLPLHQRYNSMMSSQFADCVSATDGFAGAITAALFLERFVKSKPWIHLDTYAWSEKGANAQPVQAAMEFLKQMK